MTNETKRASLETVLEFCNDVRYAGGANPLDALMPATPQNTQSCLIARNLNFDCKVTPTDEHWVMETDKSVVDKIIDQLSDKWDIERYRNNAFVLPKDIGQVAADFDEWIDDVEAAYEKSKDLLPYIERNGYYIEDLLSYKLISSEEAEELRTV